MRCMNCGLPLSPGNNLANCPRCGASLNVFQGAAQQQQPGWGNMGGAPQQNPWGQVAAPGAYNPFTQQGYTNQSGLNSPGMGGFNRDQREGRQPFTPRRPVPPANHRSNPRTLFLVAGLFVFVGALILGLVAMLVFSGSGGSSPTATNTSPNTPGANSSTPQGAISPTASASPTVVASPAATGTAYPGQQYVNGAQMAMGVDQRSLQPQQPTTTFKVGSTMYVIFKLHPPTQGGAVCTYWFLNGNTNPVTSYTLAVKASSRANYTYAIYNNPGQAYVELYWASDKTCADKVLAQHVDFMVTT